MLSSICVATTTGRPCCRAARTMRFCASGTSSGGSSTPRSPRATITAVGQRQDAVQVVQRLRLLQLGHDPGPAVGDGARLRHVLRPLHEGQADVVHAVVQGEAQVLVVLLRQRGYRQHHVRHVDALAVGQRAAGDDLAFQVVLPPAGHAQAQLAVIQQQRGADAGGHHDLGVRQLHPAGVARHRGQVEAEGSARSAAHASGLEGAHPQLRPLHVGQDADRAARFRFQRADDGDVGGVVVMAAMAEVQPEHVGAAAEQPAEHVSRAAGRADGGDDLGAAAAAQLALCHGSVPLRRQWPRAGGRARRAAIACRPASRAALWRRPRHAAISRRRRSRL